MNTTDDAVLRATVLGVDMMTAAVDKGLAAAAKKRQEKSKQERKEAMSGILNFKKPPWRWGDWEYQREERCYKFVPAGCDGPVPDSVSLILSANLFGTMSGVHGLNNMTILSVKTNDSGRAEIHIAPEHAEFIVRAVNSHNELVAALEALQFFRHEENGVPYCPACLRHKPEGHDKFCMIGKALANARPKGERS